MGNPQTGKQLYHRNYPTGVKVLSPPSGFPAWGSDSRSRPLRIWLWRPVGFDRRNSTGLGEAETQLLEGTHKVSWTQGPRGKKQWPHKKLSQTYMPSTRGSPAEVGGGCGSLWGQGHWQQQFWEVLTGVSPHRNPPLAPPNSLSAPVLGDLRTNNQQGRNTAPPICRQVAYSLPEQGPDHQRDKTNSTHHWAGTSPSHQEACTSLLASLTRRKTAEARTTILQSAEEKQQSQEVRQNETAEEYVPDEGIRWNPRRTTKWTGDSQTKEKEFRMRVKMIQDLGKRIEARIKKMQEMYNIDLKELKNKQRWTIQ